MSQVEWPLEQAKEWGLEGTKQIGQSEVGSAVLAASASAASRVRRSD